MLYISSLCSSKKRIVDAVQELAELGFDNIELTGKTEFYDGIKEDLLGLKKRYGLNYLVHNYFPPQREDFVLNLATGNSLLKERTRNLVKEAVELSKEFSQNLYSLHPGFRYELLPKLEEGFFIKDSGEVTKKEDFYRTVDMLLKEIVPDDFRIAIENLSPKSVTDKYSFICSPEDINDFLEYYHNRPNVGILLDFGHLNIASNYLNFDKEKALEGLLTTHLDRILEMHISGNNGQVDSHGISSIDSWDVRFLHKNKETLKDKPIVLEWHHLSGSLAYERFKMISDRLEG